MLRARFFNSIERQRLAAFSLNPTRMSLEYSEDQKRPKRSKYANETTKESVNQNK